jgi:hypothetical protein
MSSEWSGKDLLEVLKANGAGGQASANVFFDDSVSADQLAVAAQQAIEQAGNQLGLSSPDATVGHVRRLAKSVSIKGDPALIAGLSKVANVKAILPSEIPDIYPKPVKKRVIK